MQTHLKTCPASNQIIDVCEDREKNGKLIQLMREIMQEQENKTLIFTETKRGADELFRVMRREGYQVGYEGTLICP